ncbi:hypothetical protein J2S66_002931 [Saccharothrix longispora]|uniref:Uncharacterized protein n=1 Tax=Saccharothrix longispora TaxID=33920 RepID=A0ABU1PV75_9PSEU|nr:hypothetical protein [Saccharothrix longispora]
MRPPSSHRSTWRSSGDDNVALLPIDLDRFEEIDGTDG